MKEICFPLRKQYKTLIDENSRATACSPCSVIRHPSLYHDHQAAQKQTTQHVGLDSLIKRLYYPGGSVCAPHHDCGLLYFYYMYLLFSARFHTCECLSLLGCRSQHRVIIFSIHFLHQFTSSSALLETMTFNFFSRKRHFCGESIKMFPQKRKTYVFFRTMAAAEIILDGISYFNGHLFLLGRIENFATQKMLY